MTACAIPSSTCSVSLPSGSAPSARFRQAFRRREPPAVVRTAGSWQCRLGGIVVGDRRSYNPAHQIREFQDGSSIAKTLKGRVDLFWKRKVTRKTDEIQAQALNERRYSSSLKVFIYTPNQSKLPHLYAVTSTGVRFALCGRSIDTTVPASRVTQLTGRMCLACRREAQEILSRKTSN
jgi:hypothetical protein